METESTLDKATLSTISLLEGRLLRVEHLLYGPTKVPRSGDDSATATLASLEKRFATMLNEIRVYSDLLKIYKSHPHLFNPDPNPTTPATMSPSAIRATVLSSTASFPATSSALTAVFDTPIPEPKLSADLAALAPRMAGIEAVQLAQAAEVAALRVRSECVLRQWYEQGIVGNSEFVDKMQRKVARVEQGVRRREREAEESD